MGVDGNQWEHPEWVDCSSSAAACNDRLTELSWQSARLLLCIQFHLKSNISVYQRLQCLLFPDFLSAWWTFFYKTPVDEPFHGSFLDSTVARHKTGQRAVFVGAYFHVCCVWTNTLLLHHKADSARESRQLYSRLSSPTQPVNQQPLTVCLPNFDSFFLCWMSRISWASAWCWCLMIHQGSSRAAEVPLFSSSVCLYAAPHRIQPSPYASSHSPELGL